MASNQERIQDMAAALLRAQTNDTPSSTTPANPNIYPVIQWLDQTQEPDPHSLQHEDELRDSIEEGHVNEQDSIETGAPVDGDQESGSPASPSISQTIDKMIAAAAAGREVKFVPKEDGLGYDIYVTLSCTEQEDGEDDGKDDGQDDEEGGDDESGDEVETQIARFPEIFGNIIVRLSGLGSVTNEVDRQVATHPKESRHIVQCYDGPFTPLVGARAPKNSPAMTDPFTLSPKQDIAYLTASVWLGAAERGLEYETPPGSILPDQPAPESPASFVSAPEWQDTPNDIIALTDENEEEYYFVLDDRPVTLDFGKSREDVATPSVHSGESVFDCSSPVIDAVIRYNESQMRQRMEQVKSSAANREKAPISEGTSVEENEDWWKGPTMTETKEATGILVIGREKLAVFADEASEQGVGATAKPKVSHKTLKDVTNLRQPGYLQRNSFSRDKTPKKHTTNENVQQKDTFLPSTKSLIIAELELLAELEAPGPLGDTMWLSREDKKRQKDLMVALRNLERNANAAFESSAPINQISDPSEQRYSEGTQLERLEPGLWHPAPLKVHKLGRILDEVEAEKVSKKERNMMRIDALDEEMEQRARRGPPVVHLDARQKFNPEAAEWRPL
ncbi:hypothetical protein MMC09_006512 [Bachmanniomyces sp. S44760]|nr:hypothetical protein [Bachmanniomyces sp. S44760]